MASLLDLIDLKDTKTCVLKINNKKVDLVHLRKEQNKFFAVIAGGKNIEITNDMFQNLSEQLGEHLQKHIMR